MTGVKISLLKKKCLELPNDSDLGKWLRSYVMLTKEKSLLDIANGDDITSAQKQKDK